MCLKYESVIMYFRLLIFIFDDESAVGRTRVNISHAYVQHRQMYVQHQHTLMIYTTFRTTLEIMLVYVIKANTSCNQNWY